MAWSNGLSVGCSFAELCCASKSESFVQRWYLQKKSLASGIKDFLQQHPQVELQRLFVSTKMVQRVMEQRRDPKLALLVTTGFQMWPGIRQVVKPNYFSIYPHRSQPLISTDLIFGITERINQKGEVITPVDSSELEFLVVKLKLAQISKVAVGFLHSQTNPINEIQVAEYFRKEGLTVLCSHEVNASNNEVARWWRAILNTYLVDDFMEQHQELKEALPENCEIHYWSSEGIFSERDHSRFFPSLFGNLEALRQQASRSQQSLTAQIHFGLEEFFIMSEGVQEVYLSDLGPIATTFPSHQLLSVQPLQRVEMSPWGCAHFSSQEIHSQSSSMIFGRGGAPSFLDLLFVVEQLPPIQGLIENVSMKMRTQILDSIILAEQHNKNRPQSIAQDLIQMACDLVAMDVGYFVKEDRVILSGELSTLFGKELQKRLPRKEFFIQKGHHRLESYAVSQGCQL